MKLACCALVLALAACGGKSEPAATTPPSTMAAADDDPSCPLVVPGTSLSVEDTNQGGALVFVTTGDPLPVRARAARLAEMHNKQDGPPSALGMMFGTESTATATEIEGGARVEIAANQPTGVETLQKNLRMHAGHLAGASSCKM